MRLGAVPLGRDSGVAYYRVLIPMRKMTEVDKSIQPLIKFSNYMNNIDDDEMEELAEMGSLCDIIILQRRYGQRWENMVKTWKEQGCKVVYEIDDAYQHIPLVNIKPSYREMCKPQTTQAVGRIMSMCDYVTVSTPELREWVMRVSMHGKNTIFWLKNTLDLSMWKRIEKAPIDEVMIGYAGSEQHVLDLPVLGGSLHEMFMRHHEKVSFGFMGYITPDMWSIDLLEGEVYFKGGEPFLQYPEALAHLGFDIGLAPVADNFFNSCKSELKYLEYSALGIPTIASDTAPYRRAIGYSEWDDQKCRGLLIKNKPRKFLRALEVLFKDADLRKHIGQNAHNYVLENYNIELYVADWLATYKFIEEGRS